MYEKPPLITVKDVEEWMKKKYGDGEQFEATTGEHRQAQRDSDAEWFAPWFEGQVERMRRELVYEIEDFLDAQCIELWETGVKGDEYVPRGWVRKDVIRSVLDPKIEAAKGEMND